MRLNTVRSSECNHCISKNLSVAVARHVNQSIITSGMLRLVSLNSVVFFLLTAVASSQTLRPSRSRKGRWKNTITRLHHSRP
jgi:hypothetical protein